MHGVVVMTFIDPQVFLLICCNIVLYSHFQIIADEIDTLMEDNLPVKLVLLFKKYCMLTKMVKKWEICN